MFTVSTDNILCVLLYRYTVILLFSNDKTKSLFTSWKLGLIKKSNYGFGACTDTFGSHLFQLIVLLKPYFKCSSSFALSWVDKVKTGT